MKFIDNEIQQALLTGKRVYHGGNCYYIKSRTNELVKDTARDAKAARLSKYDLTTTDWSLTPLEYDYDAIIKDKVLCRFWNDCDAFSNYIYGRLEKAKDGKFNLQHTNMYFDNCEPVNVFDITTSNNPDFYRK